MYLNWNCPNGFSGGVSYNSAEIVGLAEYLFCLVKTQNLFVPKI